MRRSAVLVALFALACTKTPVSTTAGCTLANCAAMIDQCDFDIPEDADKGWCLTNTRVVPDGGLPTAETDAGIDVALLDAGTYPDETSSCVQACLAGQEGVLVACVASNASTCVDGTVDVGIAESTLDACESEQKAAAGAAPSAKCANACEVTRAHCQSTCPLTEYASCEQCSADCGLTFAHCVAACPRALAHCTDGKKDDGETDVDCGGPCGPCAEGQGCDVNADCVSDNCIGGQVCAPVLPCAMEGDCPEPTCLFGTCR